MKVADFGLVRLLEHTVTSHTGCMTPTYAAPEFFEGHTSSTSDQYSLAVTYCHLRGGKVPFTGSLAEIMSGHLRHAPDLTMLPESEQPAVARALAKDPTQRWPNCRAFVHALLECSPGGASSDAERPEPPRPKASPRRPPANFTLLPGAATPEHADAVQSVAFSPDGRFALSGGDDRAVWLWDIGGRTPRKSFLGHTDSVFSVAFSAAGSRAVSAGKDTTVRVWNVETGQERHRITVPGESIWAVTFAADARHVLTASDSPVIRLWNAETGKELRKFAEHTDVAWCVAFSAKGDRLVSAGGATDGSHDYVLRLWNIDRSQSIRQLPGHTGPVGGVALSPDGRRALSGSEDKTVRLWNVETGDELHRFANHTDVVFAVAFSPDGRRVLSASKDKTVRVWRLPKPTARREE